MNKDTNNKWYKSATMKFGMIVIAITFIVFIIASVIVILSHVNGGKIDVSNSAAEEFYVKQSEAETEESSITETTVVEQTEETTQSPAKIAATQEIKPEDLIGNGLSEEEWAYIYEQSEKNAPTAVKPFSIVELSNRAIKMYDANNEYFEWAPN